MGVIQFKGGTIQFKGGTIQFKNLDKVANPTVEAFWGGSAGAWEKKVKITNNDTEAIEAIYTGLLSGSLTYFGGINPGEQRTLTLGTQTGQPAQGFTFTAYAELRQTGRTTSDLISDVSNGFDIAIMG